MSNADFLSDRIIPDKGPVKTYEVVPVNDFGNFGSVTQVTYTVQAGDTLSKISERFYGKPDYWKNIYEANRALMAAKGPNYLERGWRLVIPPVAGVTMRTQASASSPQATSTAQVSRPLTVTQSSSPIVQPTQSFFQKLMQGPNKWLLIGALGLVGLILYKKSRKAEL